MSLKYIVPSLALAASLAGCQPNSAPSSTRPNAKIPETTASAPTRARVSNICNHILGNPESLKTLDFWDTFVKSQYPTDRPGVFALLVAELESFENDSDTGAIARSVSKKFPPVE